MLGVRGTTKKLSKYRECDMAQSKVEKLKAENQRLIELVMKKERAICALEMRLESQKSEMKRLGGVASKAYAVAHDCALRESRALSRQSRMVSELAQLMGDDDVG